MDIYNYLIKDWGKYMLLLNKDKFTKDNINKYFYLYYTLCFIVLMGFILIIFSIKGNSFIWSADGFNQLYPVLCYTSQWLKNCIKESCFLQFDFTVGLGEGIIPVLNIHGFGDPFLLLSVFVPIQKMYYYASFVVIVKIYLSGISFASYCSYKKKRNGVF